jgi:hypothetical protein
MTGAVAASCHFPGGTIRLRNGIPGGILPSVMDSKPNGFMPFIGNKDIKFLLSVYNATMRGLAGKRQVSLVEELLQTELKQNDFRDQGHLSQSGKEKISGVLTNFRHGN